MSRLIAIVGLTGLLLTGCRPAPQAPPSPEAAPLKTQGLAVPAAPQISTIARRFRLLTKGAGNAVPLSFNHPLFTEVAGAAGVSHIYDNGTAGKLLMVEPVGGGCGWIDFDRDGRLDLYLNQGGDPVAESAASRPSDQLFRSLGDGRFVSVTDLAGIDERNYSQGIAVGDYDNDGFDDIFVTNVGPDVLYKNEGDGTFTEVTDSTVGRDNLWGLSAAWSDLDLDGDLDLYVCNYCDFDPYHPIDCRNSKGMKIMCQPNNHVEPVPDECFLNLGDGTFRPVARERGLYGPGNRAMGVTIADFDNDGWPDIFVANDATANFLFINRRDGNFVNEAPLLGCAVSADGSAQANMGIALGDYDRNGWLDVYITHFEGEWNTLYRNLGPSGFQDVSAVVGLVPAKLSMVGFGTVMQDFNQDGQDELFVANGHLDDPGHLGVPLEMTPQCFTFDGRKWHDCSAVSGAYFGERFVGRGVATADFDNDGDLDVAVVHQNLPMALLRNDSRRGHWLKLQFIGRHSNRNAVGLRATVRTEGRSLLQELPGGTSYCASHERLLVFGLGDSDARCQVEIRWPDGKTQVLDDVAVDQSLLLLEPASDAEPSLTSRLPSEGGDG